MKSLKLPSLDKLRMEPWKACVFAPASLKLSQAAGKRWHTWHADSRNFSHSSLPEIFVCGCKAGTSTTLTSFISAMQKCSGMTSYYDCIDKSSLTSLLHTSSDLNDWHRKCQSSRYVEESNTIPHTT